MLIRVASECSFNMSYVSRRLNTLSTSSSVKVMRLHFSPAARCVWGGRTTRWRKCSSLRHWRWKRLGSYRLRNWSVSVGNTDIALWKTSRCSLGPTTTSLLPAEEGQMRDLPPGGSSNFSEWWGVTGGRLHQRPRRVFWALLYQFRFVGTLRSTTEETVGFF